MKTKPYIMIPTKGMDRTTWLRLRKSGIGGSEASIVCNCNPWRSPLSLFYDKIDDMVDTGENEFMKLGTLLEDAVAKRFEEETGLVTRKSNYMYRSIKYPHMICNVDRLIQGQDSGLEIKVTSQFNAEEWSNGKVPIHYLLQCFHYMYVLQKRVWYICCLVLGQKFVWRKIEWDDEIISDLVAYEKTFWDEHILKKVEPPATGTDICGEAIRRYYHTAKERTSIPLIGFDEKLRYREEIIAQIEELDMKKKLIEQEVQLYMKDAELAFSDHFKVSWTNVLTSRLNTKEIQKVHPDICKEFVRTTSSRRFVIKAA